MRLQDSMSDLQRKVVDRGTPVPYGMVRQEVVRFVQGVAAPESLAALVLQLKVRWLVGWSVCCMDRHVEDVYACCLASSIQLS